MFISEEYWDPLVTSTQHQTENFEVAIKTKHLSSLENYRRIPQPTVEELDIILSPGKTSSKPRISINLLPCERSSVTRRGSTDFIGENHAEMSIMVNSFERENFRAYPPSNLNIIDMALASHQPNRHVSHPIDMDMSLNESEIPKDMKLRKSKPDSPPIKSPVYSREDKEAFDKMLEDFMLKDKPLSGPFVPLGTSPFTIVLKKDKI